MKKICYSLLLLCLFIFPLNINADEVNIGIDCDKTVVSPGDTILCTINGIVNNGEIEGLEATINSSDKLSVKKIEVNKSLWNNLGTDPELALMTTEYKKGTFEIAKVTLEVASDVSSGTLLNVSSVSNNFVFGYTKNEVKVADVSKEIRVVSNDNSLSSLSISTGTLSPSFDKNTISYTSVVDVSNITISAVATDSKAVVTGDVGSRDLAYGLNTFKIYVKSESGESRTYTLLITRSQPVDNRDKDNTISSLTINNKTIELKNNVYKYDYQVDNDVEQARINATLTSKKAVFLDNSGTQNVTLKEGDNRVEIKVKAENEEVKIYEITINRKSKTVVEPDNEQDDTQDNDNNKSEDKKEENITESPKTGNSVIYIFILLVIISIPLGIFAYKKYQKNEV